MATTTEHPEPIQIWQRLTEGQPDADDLAEDYHEASKFHQVTLRRVVPVERLLRDPDLLAWSTLGERGLTHLPFTPLPPVERARADLTTLVRQPSCREFDPAPLAPATLSTLLAFSYGRYPNAGADDQPARRPIASGGALYPLELYLVTAPDAAAGKGVYHYSVARHGLEQVRAEVAPAWLERLTLEPDLVASAPLIILIMGMFWRTRFKYGLRGYRFALLEAGALIQQIQLVAQALGLGSVPYAGMFDDVVEQMCGIDGVDESFLNAVLVGTRG